MKLTRFKVEDYLDSDVAIIEYLNAALEENDPKFLARALGDVARAKGMADIADATGLGRQNLYETLSEKGNPTLDTLFKVLGAMGIQIKFAV